MKTNKLNFNFILYIILIVLVDIFALILSLQLAVEFRTNFFPRTFPTFSFDEIDKYYWVLLLILTIFAYEKIYFIRYDFWSDTKRVLKGLFLSFATILIVITLTRISNDYSRAVFILFFLFAAFLVPFFKRIFKKVLFKFDIFKIKVKILANEPEYSMIKKEIELNWYFGFIPNDSKYDMVLISSKKFTVNELQKAIKKFSKKTKDIYIIPYVDNIDFTYVSIVNYSNIRLSAIHIENKLLNYKNIIIKAIFEKMLVVLLAPFILFLHLFIVVLIKLDSKGSARFKQKRFTKNSKDFSCYKYRTMYENSDALLKKYLEENPDEVEYYEKYHKYKNDPRITKVGKFLRSTSLDELPQFFNILRGDMNLIGPRPYMLNELDKIGLDNQNIIFQVKPGITGLWQVSGRNDLTFEQRLELDNWYIQNWSLWLDFTIFMKTIKVVFMKIGAK
ncbi:UDP-phosphate galactose phosphotransferase [Halarcobacter mediterraneus]|uniref:UDP-phosphate galactose phosphotransferase n=1 Tax=Halarcobacter mediterraneus TaxID=2023153 RepID=A0A4Q1ARX0_9BACT|nr:sugar transferase [Halarcobacter mediterraneus]RXK12344.1 UDP-phosphate galactose phosphotransferase [Halarcobacter mediterraneus]